MSKELLYCEKCGKSKLVGLKGGALPRSIQCVKCKSRGPWKKLADLFEAIDQADARQRERRRKDAY